MDLNIFITICNYITIICLGIACYYCIKTSKLLKEWEEILEKQRNVNVERHKLNE